MANYYLDSDGRLSTKKKRKGNNYVLKDGKLSIVTTEEDDIAPVKPTTTKKEEKSMLEELADGFFDKGALSDGLSVKNVARTILGTTADVSRNVSAGILGMGEKVVDTSATVAGSVGGLFSDKFQSKMDDFVEKDLYDEKKLATTIGTYAPTTVFGNPSATILKILEGDSAANEFKDDTGEVPKGYAPNLFEDNIDKASLLGDDLAGLAYSAGQLAGTMGLQALGVPWQLTTGVTSFGGQMEKALNEDATHNEAVVSAMITAAADIIFEKLGGGSGLGEKGILKVDTLTEGIKNKAVKTLADYGIDIGTESLEEIAASVASNAGEMLYNDENLKDVLFSRESLLEYIKSGIGGGVLSGGINSVNAAQSIKSGRDYRTGVSANEQKVIDSEVQKRVSEQEKVDGKKLTRAEKTAIKEEVTENLKKGFIDIDTIESALGGDTYKSYQSILEQEAPLNTELDEIRNNDTLTDKQKKTLIEAIQGEIKTIGETSNKAQIKEQLSKEVQEMISKDSFLLESYNERSRRSQEFEIDYSQYDEKQADAIKTLIEGVKINNTRRVHEAVDYISKIAADKGFKVRLSDTQKLKEMGFEVEGKTINGLEHNGEVLVNIESKKALNAVTGHEITHLFEGTDYYDDLKSTVIEYAKSKGEYNSRMITLKKAYKKVYAQDVDFDALETDFDAQDAETKAKIAEFNAKVERELVADVVGDYLFTDEQFISNLSTKQPNIFKKIYNEIKYMLKVATAGSEQARKLEKVKKTFDKVYKQSSNVDSDAKYALEDIANMNKKSYNHHGWAKVNDVLSQIELAHFMEQNSDKLLYGDHIKPIIDGRFMFAVGELFGVNNVLVFSDGKYNEVNNKGHNGPSIEKVYRINLNNETDIEELRSLIYERENDRRRTLQSETIKDYFPDGLVELYRPSDFEDFQTVWKRYESTRGKSKVNIKFDTELQDGRGSNTETQPAINEKASSEDGVFFDAKNTNFSLSEDTKGRTLTKEQQDFLADSKIRDDNGALKVMYHGSPNTFSVFDIKKANSMGHYGKGFYFTDSESHAGQYGNAYEVYLNITNPVEAGTHNITKEQLRKFIDAVAENEDYGIENYGYGATVDSVTNSVWGKDDFGMLMDINMTAVGDMVEAVKLFNEVNGTNYDGIVAPTETVAFYPNQIKTVDNAAPTSDADIRYSLSEEIPLNKRVSGDELLNAEDLIAEIESVAEISPNGYVTLYHRTTESNAKKIMESGKMSAKEDGIFFSTKIEGENSIDYGKGVVKLKVPIEKLELDDIFSDEAHLRYPLKNRNQTLDVSKYLVNENDTKYSLSEEVRPLAETDYDKLKNFFGVTNNYNVAGYMLLDGTMLDFSGQHWGNPMSNSRDVDHRDVWDVWESEEKDGTQEMVNMISNGNIRLMPETGGINLAVPPTENQRAVLEDYINHFKGEVIVDIDRVGGDTIETFTYDKGTPSSKILKDIDRYFKGGYVSDLMQFHMSLSDKNKDIAPTRGWRVYGDDIKLEEAPVREEAQEVAQDSSRLVQDTDYAPLTPLDAYIRDMEQENPIDESYMPEEVEEPYYEAEGIEVESPFDERDIKEVGNRKVKAYMYENPEVKPFFQEEAKIMLTELRNSIKGERQYNDQLYYDTNGEQGWFGTKRATSDDIAYFLDNFKYTYADIEKGLNAIIEDNGKENNAISKRIEFALNDRLKDGYTDFLSGEHIPANQDYINLLAEKQIMTYSDEAYYEWLQTLANEEPSQDVVEPTEDIAPVRDDISIAEGTQQEFDYETGEVVDEDAKLDKAIQRINRKLAENKKNAYVEFRRKMDALQKELGSRDKYISDKALKLYEELTNLKKGVKASDELGYLLDFGFKWKELKTALLHTKAFPSSPVNENSAVEALVREAIGRDYDNRLYEIDELETEYQNQVNQLKADADNAIAELEDGNKTYRKTRKELKQALIKDDKDFFTEAMDEAKNVSVLLLNNTDTIRATELVFGRENGKIINELIFQKAIDNESKSIAWQNKERKEVKALGIKPRSKESAAVQKYGEKQYEGADGKMVAYGDVELAQEFPDIATQNKIKNAARVLRAKYDSYIDEANAALTPLGFEPIKKRQDYMRHFEALTDAFSRMGIPFNPQSMQEFDLPTDINGITETFVPQKNFFANILQRKGNKTTLDAITGIDGYIGGISNLIHHTEDIQRGRAFEDLIRENYGRANAEKVLSSIEDENAREKRRQQMGTNHLSGYVKWVHDWTDNLAGKKDALDRAPEHKADRSIFAFLDTLRKQTGANMIGFNLSSAMTNLIAPVQALAKTDKVAFAKGSIDTFKNIFKKDDFMDKNSFLTARMGTDKISKTFWENAQNAGFIFMRGMDYFTSNLIVRSKYQELISKGMSEEMAHKEAGKFAARIMGDRTKGANAQLYNSKLFNMVAQFQLEVNNQVYSTFYDTYYESKEKAQGDAKRTAAGMTFTLGQLFVATHIFGQAFQSVAGYNPTLDIIDIIATALGLGDDDEEKPLDERLVDASIKLAKGLPYISTFVDGGRIPMSKALPLKEMLSGKDDYGNEKPWYETAGEALPYYLLPAGYNQIKKTSQGLNMFSDEHPVAGSYTDSGNLRFPVEDTLANRVQAGIFGQWANENARDYFNNERKPLKSKQIEEFADLDIPIKDYWEYREGLSKQETLEDKFDYIADLDLPVAKKNIMINNVVDRKEEVDLINYDDFSSLEEFDFATKYPEKYEFLQSINVSYTDYSASEDTKKAYNWAYEYPEKYLVSKAVGGVLTYKQYTSELSDIKGDKNNVGETISGSRKKKVLDYINGLDADYGAKIILYKSEYKSDNTYNNDIVEYLNNRSDISYSEMVTILTELDFIVEADGTVRWN